MKCLWLTDTHLNFLDKEERQQYYQMLLQQQSDCIFLTGDIAEAPSVSQCLKEMVNELQQPVYFVLGNHDYYHGQVAKIQQEILQLIQDEPQLHWCQSEIAHLEEKTYIVGCDAWADGRYGDYDKSPVRLNDSRLIADLFQAECMSRAELLKKMQQLADHDAEILKQQIDTALQQTDCEKIVVLTHIPPFAEVSMHQGQPQDDDFLPYFACKATGEVILAAAEKYPHIDFLVLCGHTHSDGYFQARENCIARAGGAVYRSPGFVELMTVK